MPNNPITNNMKKPKRKRNLPESLKKKVVILQRFKCANFPNSNLKFIDQYNCPLYTTNDGLFDESGWEIDHIIEFSSGGSDDVSNLQALCPSCHRVKTKNFMIDSLNSVKKRVDDSTYFNSHLSEWFRDEYEITTDKNNVLGIKNIYENFKINY